MIAPDEELPGDTGRSGAAVPAPPSDRYSELVMVRSEISFWVRRSKQGGPFMLGDVKTSGPPRALVVYKAMLVDLPYVPTGAQSEFPECVWSKEFAIRDVTTSSDSEGPLVKAAFEYIPADKSKTKMRGWIALDPSRNWAISAMKSPGSTRPALGERTNPSAKRLGRSSPRLGPLQSCGWHLRTDCVRWNFIRDHGRYHLRRHARAAVEFTRFDVAAVPDGEFSLAAFGLGDFENPSTRKFPTG